MNKIYLFICNRRIDQDGTVDVKQGNVGDLSSYYILKHFLKKRGDKFQVVPFYSCTEFKGKRDGHYLAMVGSIVHALTQFENITVVGSGLMFHQVPKIDGNMRVLGVRGYITQSLLGSAMDISPPVIGDLGLLLPYVFPVPKNNQKKYEYAFIMHMFDRRAFSKYAPRWDFPSIGVLNQPERYVRQLLQCKRIVTSSLHGIIFAHAYGIPVLPVKVTDKMLGGDNKFIDYYSSLGYQYSGRIDLTECAHYSDKDWCDKVDAMWNPPKELIAAMQKRQLKILNDLLGEWEAKL
jgi:hypothetical protein